MNVSDVIVECFESYGINTIFGYPGGNILGIYKALANSSKIKFILSHHEQAAVHEAEGYAKASDKVGVVIVSSGPAATNTITGIADAYFDNIPLMLICGQAKINSLEKDEFQEVNISSIVKSVVKKRFQIWFPNQTVKVLREAFKTAISGRKGPVLIDLPIDVSLQQCDLVEKNFIFSFEKMKYNDIDKSVIEQTLYLIENAKRPVILAGGGVIQGNATESLKHFSEKTHIMIVSSMMGKGAVPSDFKFFYGQVGTFGDNSANKFMQDCDLLIVAGCRLTERLTGNIADFVPKAKIIQIDIDASEISKNKPVDIAIVGDVGIVFEELTRSVNVDKFPNYQIQKSIYQIDKDSDIDENNVNELIYPRKFIKALSEQLDSENSIVTTEVGRHQIWSVLEIRRNLPRTFITSGGMGTMGFGFPAAIGAYYACPDKQVVCIAGDGSFQMNLQEMATVNEEHIPIKVIVMNNGMLGMVREKEKEVWGNTIFAVELKGSPDYVGIANAYGWKAKRISFANEISDALRWLLNESEPSLLEVCYTVDNEDFEIRKNRLIY